MKNATCCTAPDSEHHHATTGTLNSFNLPEHLAQHPLSTRDVQSQLNRAELIKQLLHKRILILDGGMGTMIQAYKLEEQDYRGERFANYARDIKGNNDLLSITKPVVIKEIQAQYLHAGADILETNSFNATRISMADYGMQQWAHEINIAAAQVAREVADAATARDKTFLSAHRE